MRNKPQLFDKTWVVHLYDDTSLYFYRKQKRTIFRIKVATVLGSGLAEVGVKVVTEFSFRTICVYRIFELTRGLNRNHINFSANEYYQYGTRTVEEILKEVGLEDYCEKFALEGFRNERDLNLITVDDLKELGLKIGERRRLLAILEKE
jgi:hypothetical protein